MLLYKKLLLMTFGTTYVKHANQNHGLKKLTQLTVHKENN